MSSPNTRTHKSGSISSISSDASSNLSQSPNLSASPLSSFSGVSSALAAVSEQERETLPAANGDSSAMRRGSVDSDEAVRKYKADLLSYTMKSFDAFKDGVERRSRSNSTPLSPQLHQGPKPDAAT